MILTTSYWPANTSEPVRESTIGSALGEAAAAMPEQTALVAGVADIAKRTRWNFAELLEICESVARALLSRFEPGEHIAVWANNVPEWVFLEYGAGLAGITLVTVNPAFRTKELEYVLRQSRAAGLFHVGGFRGNRMDDAVAEVRAKLPGLRETVDFAQWSDFLQSDSQSQTLPVVGPDDAALILYTSGTTGFPKGAVLHHKGLTNNSRFAANRWGLRAGSVLVSPMPLFHAGGCSGMALGSLQSLTTLVLMQQFDPALMLELIETEKADMATGVPTMLVALEEAAEFKIQDITSLRALQTGGANVPVELVRRYEERLSEGFSVVYGLSEACPVITQTKLDDTLEDKSETIGCPLPQTEVKIIDPQSGKTQPVGESGELCARGYLVMKGYFDMPEKTAEAIDTEGWLHTGDLCSMDERGYCRVTGRLKDMIIRGGENIYPREIEERLFVHPDVVDVAVVGVPDEKWGEQVAAFVRTAPGSQVSGEELSGFARQELASYKTPKIWVSVKEFPLTGPGKVQKFRLREMWEQGEVIANM